VKDDGTSNLLPDAAFLFLIQALEVFWKLQGNFALVVYEMWMSSLEE
jgi:hypothetical protein